jgi:hypothetical protein
MRWPTGSVSCGSDATSIQPATWVFGTLSVSTTRIQGRGCSAAKYSAATFSSSSLTAFDTAIMRFTGRLAGSELLLAPLRKSSTCCTMYCAGRPARLEFSGRPSPFGRWQ